MGDNTNAIGPIHRLWIVVPNGLGVIMAKKPPCIGLHISPKTINVNRSLID